MKLVFATHNLNKFIEVQKLVPTSIVLVSLDDIGCDEEIPETGKTLKENAQIKADYVTINYGLSCFADDTGLMVNCLNGAPGVYSARYAGQAKDANANMTKLLNEMDGCKDRSARFETVIALNMNSQQQLFTGIVHGQIITEKRGDKGFGYDPIFQPEGFEKTFAELTMKEKNTLGHRGRAIAQLIEFLNTLALPQ